MTYWINQEIITSNTIVSVFYLTIMYNLIVNHFIHRWSNCNFYFWITNSSLRGYKFYEFLAMLAIICEAETMTERIQKQLRKFKTKILRMTLGPMSALSNVSIIPSYDTARIRNTSNNESGELCKRAVKFSQGCSTTLG